MVASILSKKLTAGSTHLVIDLPIGPSAKLHSPEDAVRLRKLFEFVGALSWACGWKSCSPTAASPSGAASARCWAGARRAGRAAE